MPAKLPCAGSWYGEGDVVKKVSGKGAISMRRKLWAIGEAFSGEEVALRETGEDRYEIYYCWKKLGVMDLKADEAAGAGGSYRQLSERAKSRQTSQDESPEVGKSVNDVSGLYNSCPPSPCCRLRKSY